MNPVQAINRLERLLQHTAALFADRKQGAPFSLDEALALIGLEEAIAESIDGIPISAKPYSADLSKLPKLAPVEDEYSHREQCEIYLRGCSPSCEED